MHGFFSVCGLRHQLFEGYRRASAAFVHAMKMLRFFGPADDPATSLDLDPPYVIAVRLSILGKNEFAPAGSTGKSALLGNRGRFGVEDLALNPNVSVPLTGVVD